MTENQNVTLGDLVRIKESSFLGSGELAYCYDTYRDFDGNGLGVCLITESGVDTGGWSREEQLKYLDYEKHSGWDYTFENVIKLSRDFDDGVFDRVFN